MRFIEGIPVDRAKARFTVVYAVDERLSVGLEANPVDADYGPLVNWRAVDETEHRPALILGTSSDRIGTPSGRAFYATLSKDLEQGTGLPIAPYAGTAYGQYDHDWELIGGLRIRWSDRWSTTSLWDGENLHHILDRDFDRYRVGLVVVEQGDDYYFGLSLGGSL